MANATTVKFIKTVSERLSLLEIANGQLIFVSDTREIYLDFNGVRTKYSQIILLINESQREGLTKPLTGFYFVQETNVFWRFADGKWIQLTSLPKTDINFVDDESELPQQGESSVLYSSKSSIYRWDELENQYIDVSKPKWETI